VTRGGGILLSEPIAKQDANPKHCVQPRVHRAAAARRAGTRRILTGSFSSRCMSSKILRSESRTESSMCPLPRAATSTPRAGGGTPREHSPTAGGGLHHHHLPLGHNGRPRRATESALPRKPRRTLQSFDDAWGDGPDGADGDRWELVPENQ